MLSAFWDGKYDLSDYPAILGILLDLNVIDMISEPEIEKTVDKMCANVQGQAIPNSYDVKIDMGTQFGQNYEPYRSLLKKIKEAATGHSLVRQSMIDEALNDGIFYTTEINNYYTSNSYLGDDMNSYILMANLEKLMVIVKKSDAREIHKNLSFANTDGEVRYYSVLP